MKTKNTGCPAPPLGSPFGKVTLREQSHFSLAEFLFLFLHATPWDNYLVYNPLSAAVSDSTQISCKCSPVPKIIITVSDKIMHSYNVCYIHKCPCSVMRCCLQEYTTLHNSLSVSSEMAQIMLQSRLHTEETSSVATHSRFSLSDSYAKWLFTLKESMMILSVAESFSKLTLKRKFVTFIMFKQQMWQST